jgi:spore coat protein CotH
MSSMSKGLRRGAAFILLALSGSLLTAPTSSASGLFTLNDIYNNSSVMTVQLELSDPSVASLGVDPKKYVPATVRFLVGDKDSGVINIGTHIKGTTSVEPLTGKPSMKIKFDYKSLSKQRFLGLKNMTLNAMQQDGTKLHEFGAYKLFNAMGVASSKTGWARLYINGEDKGLYINLETIDDIFLSKRFTDNTNHLYEGVALRDIKPGSADGDKNSGAFMADQGWKKVPNKADIQQLITALATKKDNIWWKNLGTYTDRTRLINQMATENFLGAWDAYSGPVINNYYIRSNAEGKFTMIPWGSDQTFGENRATPATGDMYTFSMLAPEVGFPWVQQAFHKKRLPRGVIYTRCIAYAPCKTAYLQALKAVSAKATAIKLVDAMKAAARLTSSLRTNVNAVDTANAYKFVADQQARVAKLLKSNNIK